MGDDDRSTGGDGLGAQLAMMVERKYGIIMRSRHAKNVCQTLQNRAVAKGCGSLSSYLDYLDSGAAQEDEAHLIAQVTTNVTSFFREPHHFERLRAHVAQLPTDRAVRCWSAGCSTGQEPWSALTTIAPMIAPEMRRLMLVLGTDIDPVALAQARAAIYPVAGMQDIPLDRRAQFMTNATTMEPRADLRPLMRIRTLNLTEPFPFKARFDVIFCRNTLIYFGPEQRADVVRRLAARMHPGALLMLGHSETLHKPPAGLEPAGRTAYRRMA
ncbi:chemotaxis protein methyltransferase CheR [Monaibacterium marinum]|uniref:protein-glutamate O-methyltransferase n=1 Tax=Pontivivens marinum TaxID=1690039 RepID=A0A2C9CN67_9RHOB|nr:CheR family methyltransferase [Monaibacterium marinum]SOH92754.1 chemotaxis protein methyltransferase CheR [Monaibacterium marinum]